MREALKNNVWDFSVAKNYNDNIAINNLLLKEDGSLRSWSDFKYEAEKIVGRSNRYLKTEYNTVVAGAQMSRLWQEIQRDKHLFPFVKFDVIMDGHTSEICSPLHNVIVSVDDPILMYYFPPNHFNCRTTLRKLRRGVPTKNYILPDIPKSFMNNPGITGKIFTDGNRYIANTPDEVLTSNNKRLRKLKNQELKEWAKMNIPDTGLIINSDNIVLNEVRVSRNNVKSLVSHFTNNDLKDMIKDLEEIIRVSQYLEHAPLAPSKANYNKKLRAGVVGYHYYTFTWKGQLFRLNMEVINDMFERPYAINMIVKNKS